MVKKETVIINKQTQRENLLEKISYIFSWLLLVVAVCILIAGSYVAYKKLAKNTEINIVLKNDDLSSIRQKSVTDTLQNFVKGSFFSVNLVNIKDELIKLDWTKSVKVVRKWPNIIEVKVLPRHAIARYGSERLLSTNAVIYKAEGVNSQQYRDLPLLYGPKNKAKEIIQQFNHLNKWFAQSSIELVEISLTEQMTWFLKFDNGMRVIVDKENTQEKLFNLNQMFSGKLSTMIHEISYIDLRYRNGMAISWKNKQPEYFESVSR